VVTLDIPGAFMQADMDKVLYMKLEGPLAHLLTKVDPKQYSQFVATERGKKVIYVKLKKALYYKWLYYSGRICPDTYRRWASSSIHRIGVSLSRKRLKDQLRRL
jgi:hypothetical protein